MVGKPEPIWKFTAHFWAKVSINSKNQFECWNWNGKLGSNGYGVVRRSGRDHRAHRIAYELAYGPIENGHLVRHLCHNRRCVNPEHLALGDKRDNAQDDMDAGKVKTGSERWSSKFSDREVEIIRDPSITARQAAEIVGCSLSYAYELRRHKNFFRRSEPKRR